MATGFYDGLFEWMSDHWSFLENNLDPKIVTNVHASLIQHHFTPEELQNFPPRLRPPSEATAVLTAIRKPRKKVKKTPSKGTPEPKTTTLSVAVSTGHDSGTGSAEPSPETSSTLSLPAATTTAPVSILTTISPATPALTAVTASVTTPVSSPQPLTPTGVQTQTPALVFLSFNPHEVPAGEVTFMSLNPKTEQPPAMPEQGNSGQENAKKKTEQDSPATPTSTTSASPRETPVTTAGIKSYSSATGSFPKPVHQTKPRKPTVTVRELPVHQQQKRPERQPLQPGREAQRKNRPEKKHSEPRLSAPSQTLSC